MQPCKILCGKLEINFSVFPLPSTLLPEAHYSAAASPLLRPLLTPKSFTFKEQLSAFKDLSGQLLEAEEELPQVPPNPSRFTCPAEGRTQPKPHPHRLPRPPGWTAALKRRCRTALQGPAFFSPHNPIMFNWEIKSLEKCTFSLGNFYEFSPISMHSCCQPCPGSRGTHSTSSC